MEKDYDIYEGVDINELKLIPEVSCYNHNYYIGFKQGGKSDLILAESDDDDTTIYYDAEGNNTFGYSHTSEGDIIHTDKGTLSAVLN